MPLFSAGKMVVCVLSGHTSVSQGPTDFCRTPTPAGPVPMPYPNVALSVTPGPGVSTKTLTFGTPIYTTKSKSALSNGDQPGVALGVVSNKVMGMCETVMGSSDVFVEGGGVARTLDKTNGNM